LIVIVGLVGFNQRKNVSAEKDAAASKKKFDCVIETPRMCVDFSGHILE